MPKKLKQAEDPCTQAFTEQQHENFPDEVWKFLIQILGSHGTIHQLKPSQYRGYAEDFLSSETGRTFWPVSSLGQWSHDSSQKDVVEFIAKRMMKEEKQRTEKDPTYLVDLADAMPPPPPKRSPNKSKSNRRKDSNIKGTASGAISTSPQSRSAGQRSPTILPDIPYEEPVPSPTQRRSIRPTPASYKIADAVWASVEPDEIQDPYPSTPKPSGRKQMQTEHNSGQSSARKRTLDDPSKRSRSTTSDTSLSYRPSKKRAVEITISTSPSPTDPEPSQQELADLAMATATADDETSSPPPPEIYPAASTSYETTDPVQTTSASATDLTQSHNILSQRDELIRLPQTILEYIDLCRSRCASSAYEVDDERKKRRFQNREMIFRDVYEDVESMVKVALAGILERDKGKERVTTYSLRWSWLQDD